MIAPSTSTHASNLRPAPLQIRKAVTDGMEAAASPGLQTPPILRIDTNVGHEYGQEQGMDMWDQYGNLGGHTPIELVRRRVWALEH